MGLFGVLLLPTPSSPSLTLFILLHAYLVRVPSSVPISSSLSLMTSLHPSLHPSSGGRGRKKGGEGEGEGAGADRQGDREETGGGEACSTFSALPLLPLPAPAPAFPLSKSSLHPNDRHCGK